MRGRKTTAKYAMRKQVTISIPSPTTQKTKRFNEFDKGSAL